ncbi:adenylate/guanylate cyclase domain-containing protein [Fibrella aquatica]|uniref:adenylate/guanylate cyclase domain-containing protein n=1 Tax=Fibrella aquatica TaxID=3242487 RepID=UPI00352063C6
MSVKSVLQDVAIEIQDILSTDFQFNVSATNDVPGFDDPGLTFGTGQTKRAKKLETCVLFIDIRNSTQLNLRHQPVTLGRLYTAFTKTMITVADFHGGKVRNIIGDRLMVVFPKDACFTSAVHCAITMNMVSRQINEQFKANDFSCGIGVDYGEMLVLKTGLYRRGEERNTNRNLVWLGKPANIASKLTDLANKEIKTSKVNVAYKSLLSILGRPFGGLGNRSLNPLFGTTQDRQFTFKNSYEPDEFVKRLAWFESAKTLSYKGGELQSFHVEESTTLTAPILITEAVFNGYKAHNSNANDVVQKWWKPQSVSIPNFKGQVYGSGLVWKV